MQQAYYLLKKPRTRLFIYGWMQADRQFVEEVGAMNMFFKIDGKIVTAP